MRLQKRTPITEWHIVNSYLRIRFPVGFLLSRKDVNPIYAVGLSSARVMLFATPTPESGGSTVRAGPAYFLNIPTLPGMRPLKAQIR